MHYSNCLKCLFLTANILLVGCGITSKSAYFNKETYSPKDYGIVTFKISQSRAPGLFNKKTDNYSELYFKFMKLGETGSYHGGTEIDSWLYSAKETYKHGILMLKPGIYYIDYIALLPSATKIYWFPSPGVQEVHSNEKKYYYVNYGAFEVKVGAVTHLGDLRISSNYSLPFKITNEINKVKEYFIENEFDRKIIDKIRFDKFYQRGSIISLTKTGYRILPKELLEKISVDHIVSTSKSADKGKNTE